MNETVIRELAEWIGLPLEGKRNEKYWFTAANDVRLLTDKLVADGLEFYFENYAIKQPESSGIYALAEFLRMSPTEQADKIHEFLTTINEIQSGG